MSLAAPLTGLNRIDTEAAQNEVRAPAPSERPYFTAAIGVILTVGALWGVIILLRIALNGSFTSVGVHEVNAHGHAQIFGWVGLFVMGFAYRVLPSLLGRGLPWKNVARVSWLALLGGLVIRAGLQPFVQSHPWLIGVAHIGSALEIAAISLFGIQMSWILRRVPAEIVPGAVWLLRGAITFFVIQAIASAAYFHLTAQAPDRESLLWLISHFQPPLRDLQVHGFAMLMVLGVGMILLPRWFGSRQMAPRKSTIVAAMLITAVVAEITGFLMMRVVGTRWAAVWGTASLLLLGSSLWIVLGTRLLKPFPVKSRGSKFIRTAHGWLLISLTMLMLLPLWQFAVLPRLAPGSHAVEIGFSHAYYGAIRHAITVGFLSLMILGMSSRLMEELRGASAPAGNLMLPFVLVNAGCLMRVAFQMLTDIHPLAFKLAGISGILELTGIGFWAVWMIGAMYRRDHTGSAGSESLLTWRTGH